jgi:hypothetical protein
MLSSLSLFSLALLMATGAATGAEATGCVGGSCVRPAFKPAILRGGLKLRAPTLRRRAAAAAETARMAAVEFKSEDPTEGATMPSTLRSRACWPVDIC